MKIGSVAENFVEFGRRFLSFALLKPNPGTHRHVNMAAKEHCGVKERD